VNIISQPRELIPNPFSCKEKGLFNSVFWPSHHFGKVPLFLREGFRVSFLLAIEFPHSLLSRGLVKATSSNKKAADSFLRL